MLQRSLSAAFAKGQYVFPGGKVDDADHGAALEAISDGLDDASASAQLGMEKGGLAWLVAAIRECFEEAGVLLARPVDDGDVVCFDTPDKVERFGRTRHEIHDGTTSLEQLCADEGLVLLTDRMHLVDHWVTPMGERRRFDTRFFVAVAPTVQEPLHDDSETIASLWVRPGDAIEQWKNGDLQMFPPTVASLRFLEPHATAADAMAAAEEVGVPTPVIPKVVLDAEGRVAGVKLVGDEGYDDLPDPEFVLGFPR